MVRQVHLIAVVGTFLIGCAVLLLLVVGCSGTSSETSNKKEQGSSPEATEAEEARCDETQPIGRPGPLGRSLTNDLPGCPKGGLLLGTDKPDGLIGEKGDDEIRGLGGTDYLEGGSGDDEIRGLGGNDELEGGPGSDVLYGGEGDDFLQQILAIRSGDSEDVFYGGDGNDQLFAEGGPRVKLYCGEGRDKYTADKDDYVDSSCENKVRSGGAA